MISINKNTLLLLFVLSGFLFSSQAFSMSKVGFVNSDDHPAYHQEAYHSGQSTAEADGESEIYLDSSQGVRIRTGSLDSSGHAVVGTFYKTSGAELPSSDVSYEGLMDLTVFIGNSSQSSTVKAPRYVIKNKDVELRLTKDRPLCDSVGSPESHSVLPYYKSKPDTDELHELRTVAAYFDGNGDYTHSVTPTKQLLLLSRNTLSTSWGTTLENSCGAYSGNTKRVTQRGHKYTFTGTQSARFYLYLPEEGATLNQAGVTSASQFSSYPGVLYPLKNREGYAPHTYYNTSGSKKTYQSTDTPGWIVVDYEPNTAPTVTASSSVTLGEGQSGSFTCNGADADGDSLSYEWKNLYGDTGNLVLTNTRVLNFTAYSRTQSAGSGTYQVQCRAYDGEEYSPWSNTVTLTSNPAPEVWSSTLSINGGETKTHSASITEDGSYSLSWSVDSCNDLTLSNTSSNPVSVTAPSLVYPAQNRTCRIRATAKDAYQSAYKSLNVYINSRPVANAGADIRAVAGQTVTLSGSASDINEIDSYAWSNRSGDSGNLTISNSSSRSASITIPSSATGGDYYEFLLRASDNNGFWSDYDPVRVALNYNPIAVATASTYDANVNTTVTLRGSASYDDSRDPAAYRGIASYKWTKISGPSVSLSSSTAANPTFTAPEGDSITFELEVTDLDGGKDTARVTIDLNRAPVIGASTSVTTGEGIDFSLTCSASDADGDSMTYQWRNVSGDDGDYSVYNQETITLTARAATQANGNDTVNLQCRAYDGNLYSSWSSNFTINSNPSPEVNAGSDRVVLSAQNISITGSVTEDSSVSGYLWQNTGGDNGQLSLNNSTSQTVSFTAPDLVYPTTDKSYKLLFSASDIYNYGTTDDIWITVNSRPQATAPDNVRVNPGETISVTGSGNDHNGSITSYTWANEGSDSGNPSLSNTGSSTVTAVIPSSASGGNYFILSLRARDNHNQWSDKKLVTLSTNYFPTAVASSDRTSADPGETVTLIGDGSYDSNSDPSAYRGIASYRWTQTDGPSLILSNANIANPVFTASAGASATFELEVTDLDGATSTDQVTITLNRHPVIGGASETTRGEGQSAYFVCAATDPDGNDLSYQWRNVSGDDGDHSIENTRTLNLTASSTTQSEGVKQYRFNCRAFDGSLYSDWSGDYILNSNPAPESDAGADVYINSNTNHSITGVVTEDESVSRYEWGQETGDSGSLTLSNTASATVSFTTPDVVHPAITPSYILYLRAEDNYQFGSKDFVTVFVDPRPLANAGEDIRVTPGQSGSVTGAGSDNGNITSYEWSNHSGDSGDLPLSNTDSPTVTVSVNANAVNGEAYILKLRVQDNNGQWSDYDYVTVNTNFFPTAVASANPTVVNPGDSVQLFGDASYDDPRDPIEYRIISSHRWVQIDGPEAPLSDSNIANPTFIAPQGEELTFRLTATDIDNGSDTDEITILINRPPTIDDFSYANPLVIHESNGVSDRYSNVITLNNPDDPDLHYSGSTESLIVSWSAVKTNSGDAVINLTYDASDVNGDVVITTNDYSEETLFTLTARVTDSLGLYTEKSLNVRANALPELTFANIDVVNEQESATLNIASVTDDIGVTDINWRVQKNGVSFTNESYSSDGMSVTFTTADTLSREMVKFIVSVTDTDNGTIEFEKDIYINARPEMELSISLPVDENGVYYVSGPTLTQITTGDGDFISNDEMLENGSRDPDGHIASIQWEQLSGPSASSTLELPWSGGLTPEYSGYKTNSIQLNDVGASYVFRLTGTDNDGATDSLTFQIYVNAIPDYDLNGSAISLRYNARGFLSVDNLTDPDGSIESISWVQLSGPVSAISDPTARYTSFTSMGSLLGEDDKTFIFKVDVKDDKGFINSKNVSFTASDVFFGCGDLSADSQNPPGGACQFNAEENHGVIINDTCNTQVTNLYIPASLDNAGLRSSLLSECELRHQYECKKCIPEPLAERYETCQLLPYMMPPKMQSYTISNGVVEETENAPQDSNFGQPINTGEWNSDSALNLWGASTDAEYESMYLDRENYPATRCLDVTDHIHYLNGDENSVSFVTPVEHDPNSEITPLDTLPCWNWDLMYRCVEPVVNTCDDWSNASGYPGNLNSVPFGWDEIGQTDVVVDNYLFWLFGPDGAETKNVYDGVPQDSVLNTKRHFIGQERWQIQCVNEETGVFDQNISDTFCERDSSGNVNRLRCNPSFTQIALDIGAMPLNENGEPVDKSEGPHTVCNHHNVRPITDCEMGYIQDKVDALSSLEHFEMSRQTLVSHTSDFLLGQAMCVEDPNNTETLVNNIMDDPRSFYANWESGSTNGEDDCWSWNSRWMFYNGEQTQWCTLNCSDGSTGVKQELVGCGLIDEAATPIPEWETYGAGWSQCVEPVIRTLCPIDAETSVSINGESASEDALAGMDCSEGIGYTETTATGEIVSSETVAACVDYSESLATCIPDPNCELVSITPVDEESGIYTNQYQEYVCTETRTVCEKTVEVEDCSLPDDLMFTQDEESSFDKAIQAMQIVDGMNGNTEFNEGELRIFNGQKLKCKYWTNDAIALYNLVSAAITAATTYFSGGTGAYLIAGVGAAELMSSQAFINQQGVCCDRDPERVSKKINMDTPITSAANNILGSEPQGKVPVCYGQEIQLAYSRSMDAHDGHIVSGSKHGFYYEGAAIKKKPFGTTGSYNDVQIPHPLRIWDKLTLIKGQEWCSYDNVIARIVQVGARHQLKQLAMNSAIDGNHGAIETSESFSYVGSSADDHGWKLINSDINRSQMAVFQWSPECSTEEGKELAQKGEIKCPYDVQEVYTAFCSSDTDCDLSEIQGDPSDPTDDWDPRRGVKGKWDVINQYTFDDAANTLTQFIVKKGACNEVSQTCDWSLYAWPAGGASTSISYELTHAVRADSEAFTTVLEESNGEQIKGYTDDSYTTQKYELRFSQLAYGQDFPSEIDVEIKDYNTTSSSIYSVTLPVSIDTIDGFDVPGTDLKIYGGCDESAGVCDWKVVVPVTITAIPDDSCRGLSVDELMVVDFTQIDFSEYEEALIAKVADTGLDPDQMKALAGQVVSQYTDDVLGGVSDKAGDKTNIGLLNSTAFVGPQIDMLKFSQQLPYDLGFIDEIDIDWGDGTVDTGIRFNSMMNLWESRVDDVTNDYYAVCLPSLETYNVERNSAEQTKLNAWNNFLSCVNNGNSGPVYTAEDLNDNQIAACNSAYSAYDSALFEFNKLTCGAVIDRFHDLAHCVNSSGNNGVDVFITEQDVSESISNNKGCNAEYVSYREAISENETSGSCGADAIESQLSHTGCGSTMLSTISSRDAYRVHYDEILNSGEAYIEYEHLWPSLSEDRVHEITITAKTYATKGNKSSGVVNSQTFTGTVYNYSEVIEDSAAGEQISAFISSSSVDKGESPKINNKLDESTLLNPTPDGAMEELRNDLNSE